MIRSTFCLLVTDAVNYITIVAIVTFVGNEHIGYPLFLHSFGVLESNRMFFKPFWIIVISLSADISEITFDFLYPVLCQRNPLVGYLSF